MKPLTLDELREVPHGKIKDKTLQSICDRANEISAEPHRINREAWEPCAKCRSCASCVDSCESAKDPSCMCFSCSGYGNHRPRNFCPECGRPLTDAAWEMLEKRLEGLE